MKEAKISDIKNHLSRYLALVRLLDRDRPIAHIVPILAAVTGGHEALADMERKGLIRRGTGAINPDLLEHDPPGMPSGVLAALLDERDGR